MSDTPAFTLSHKHRRAITMLYSLRMANASNTFPTITEMAKAFDGRSSIPRPTLASRRTMIHVMERAGFLRVHHIDDKDRPRYEITAFGISELRRYRLGVAS